MSAELEDLLDKYLPRVEEVIVVLPVTYERWDSAMGRVLLEDRVDKKIGDRQLGKWRPSEQPWYPHRESMLPNGGGNYSVKWMRGHLRELLQDESAGAGGYVGDGAREERQRLQSVTVRQPVQIWKQGGALVELVSPLCFRAALYELESGKLS